MMKRLLQLLLTVPQFIPAALPAAAQVTLGYRNPIFSAAFLGAEEQRGIRETMQFSVTGVNVVPADGSLIYDENTIWVIDQPDRSISLRVIESGPLLETRNSDLITRTVQASRTERLFVQVSGPASEALRSVFLDGLPRLEDATLPAVRLSVFTP
jgi:hypothetical protein